MASVRSASVESIGYGLKPGVISEGLDGGLHAMQLRLHVHV